MDDTNSKKSRKRIHWIGLAQAGSAWLLALVGVVGVVFLLVVLAGGFNDKVESGTSEKHNSVPSHAQLATVRTEIRTRFESAVGSIEPIHESSVASKILARVTEVNVSAGQNVLAGDVLVRLNDEDLQSRLKQAEALRDSATAQLHQATSDLQRAHQLSEARAISQAELESATTVEKTSRAELDRAARAVEEAKVMLAYSTIEAPFSGIVVEKKVQAGDTVIPGQTLLAIYDPNQMQLVANVRESLAMGLKIGQQLPARLEALGHECMATVREVVPQADIGSRSFQVKVSGPCPAGIYSGMFARLMLPLEDETITLVPRSAIRRVGQLTLVDAVESGLLVRRNVQIGRSLGADVEVLSGLTEGEVVLLNASSEGPR